MQRILPVLAALLSLATPAVAAEVRPCDQTASAGNIVEPWEKYARTFYKGQVRVALLDTGGEPACCSFHLLVTIPPSGDEPGGGQTCFVVSEHSNFGYGRIWFEKMTSSYDPKRGLLLTIPAIVSNGDDEQHNVVVKVRANIAAHSVAVER